VRPAVRPIGDTVSLSAWPPLLEAYVIRPMLGGFSRPAASLARAVRFARGEPRNANYRCRLPRALSGCLPLEAPQPSPASSCRSAPTAAPGRLRERRLRAHVHQQRRLRRRALLRRRLLRGFDLRLECRVRARPELPAGTCAQPSGTVVSCLLAPALTLLHDGSAGAGLTVSRAMRTARSYRPGRQLRGHRRSQNRYQRNSNGRRRRPGTITAQLGSVTCTAQTLSYGAPPADKLRAVVIDQTTGRPLAGAVVGLDDLSVNAITTRAAQCCCVAQPRPHDVHAFLDDFTFTSFLGTDSTDLLVPLQPEAWYTRRGYVTGQLGQQDFDKLPNPGAGVHAAIFGVSNRPASSI